MILLDGGSSILRARGEPIVFRSPEETLEYARIHDIQRWMVYGDREGWWPIYTQSGALTVPEFLRFRYDERTQILNAVSLGVMMGFISGISLYAIAAVTRVF